ncbi:hypothetical protein [Streptomyces sp. UG1]|uniref:hypothetical protein n=1 Tax=Streptomyces sp. UG1 TaxID=3417652 RepID=UPI003CF641E5
MMFLDAIEHLPGVLAGLTRVVYAREAGALAVELFLWLIVRGALGPRIRRVHETCHARASDTDASLVLYESLNENTISPATP